jgi:hypothetical protein
MCHLQTSLSGNGLAEVKNGWAIWAKKGHTMSNEGVFVYIKIK